MTVRRCLRFAVMTMGRMPAAMQDLAGRACSGRLMSGALTLSGIRSAPGRSGEQHAVMDHAQDLDDTVQRDPVDNQVSRFRNAMLSWHTPARRAEMEGSDPGKARHLARTRDPRQQSPPPQGSAGDTGPRPGCPSAWRCRAAGRRYGSRRGQPAGRALALIGRHPGLQAGHRPLVQLSRILRRGDGHEAASVGVGDAGLGLSDDLVFQHDILGEPPRRLDDEFALAGDTTLRDLAVDDLLDLLGKLHLYHAHGARIAPSARLRTGFRQNQLARLGGVSRMLESRPARGDEVTHSVRKACLADVMGEPFDPAEIGVYQP